MLGSEREHTNWGGGGCGCVECCRSAVEVWSGHAREWWGCGVGVWGGRGEIERAEGSCADTAEH